jgi:hypothetical protein
LICELIVSSIKLSAARMIVSRKGRFSSDRTGVL